MQIILEGDSYLALFAIDMPGHLGISTYARHQTPGKVRLHWGHLPRGLAFSNTLKTSRLISTQWQDGQRV